MDIACAGDRRDRHLPKEDNVPRGVMLDLAPESIPGQFKLGSRQFGGLRCWSLDHRCETATIAKERAVVLGTNLLGSKTCEMHDPPEPIASARKVMTCGCRTDAWIDSAKYEWQMRCDDVRKRLKSIRVNHR